jgi:hypothetical protein
LNLTTKTLVIILAGFYGFCTAQEPERPRLEVRLAPGGGGLEGDFSWEGLSGRAYFVQSSAGLEAWTYLPLVVAGADREESAPVAGPGPRLFARLAWVASDAADPWSADFDGDRLSNGLELSADPQLDPLDGGSADGDAVPDDWERHHFGGESAFGDGGDPDADAAGNLEEFESGGDPNHPDHPLVPLLLYHANS